MKRKIIFFTIFVILLGGCCKDCDVTEKLSYPKTTRSGVKYISDMADLSRVAWWKKLKDPQLDQLIAQALACNDRIKSSYATIEQAQAQLKAAQYAWIPTFDATAGGFSGETWNFHGTPRGALANNSSFSSFSNPQFRGYYAGFVPRYTVNILSNINHVTLAKAALEIQLAQVQATKLGIISQMSGTYFMLLSQREQWNIENALSHDLKKLRYLEKIRFQKGASNLEVITNLDQQIAQEETRIPQIEQVIHQSENTIHFLLNQKPGPVATNQAVFSHNLNQFIPSQLPASVLKNRPDIMIAVNHVKMASAQVGIAYAEFFPTISLTGLLGNASVDLTNLLKLSTNLWLMQAIASLKVFHPSSYQNIKSAKAGFKATYYQYLEALRFALVDVDDVLTLAYKNRLSYLHAEKGYLAAKSAYSLAVAQYKAGATDYRNVMSAKINLERSKLNLVQGKALLFDSIVQVYGAVAGGYDAPIH